MSSQNSFGEARMSVAGNPGSYDVDVDSGIIETYINKSGLLPLGCAVLVKPYEPERRGGLIQIPDNVKDRTVMLEQRAIVIAVGPTAWEDESVPRANPGDKVLVSKFAGYMAKGTGDGESYRLVNDRDIFAAIIEETSHE